MDKIKEEELRERNYELLMKSALKLIGKVGLEPVHGQAMSFILEENLKHGYRKHATVNIKQFTDALKMDKQAVLDDLKSLSKLNFALCEDDSVTFSWGKHEYNGDAVTITIDGKFFELFMRALARHTVKTVSKAI